MLLCNIHSPLNLSPLMFQFLLSSSFYFFLLPLFYFFIFPPTLHLSPSPTQFSPSSSSLSLSPSRDAQRPLMEGMFFSFFLYCSCIFILVFFLLVRWLLVVLFVICYFFKTLCRDLQGVLNSRRGFLPPIMVLNKLVSSKKYLWFIPKMNFKDQLNCNKSSRPLF